MSERWKSCIQNFCSISVDAFYIRFEHVCHSNSNSSIIETRMAKGKLEMYQENMENSLGLNVRRTRYYMLLLWLWLSTHTLRLLLPAIRTKFIDTAQNVLRCSGHSLIRSLCVRLLCVVRSALSVVAIISFAVVTFFPLPLFLFISTSFLIANYTYTHGPMFMSFVHTFALIFNI